MLFLIPEYSEFFAYLSITSIIYFLFFFLVVIFGYIVLKWVLKIFLTVKKEIPKILVIFLSYGIGLSIYFSLSLILLILNSFNFWFAYLPLIIIDCVFIVFQFIKKVEDSNIHDISANLFSQIRKKRNSYIFVFFLLLILFIFQILFQWPLISESKSLMFEDPYSNLKNIYYYLDNGTNDLSLTDILFYPPGFNIFCAGNLLITENYLIHYVFLKFGAIPMLFLFIIAIFFLTLEIFKKLYISFVCSILFLSCFLYTFRMNAFLSSYFATFIICISLIVFLNDTKLIYLLGFFIPLIYFINPVAAFYYYIIILIFYIIKLFFRERRKNAKEIFGILIISFLIFLPFIIFLSYHDYSITTLIDWYYRFINQSLNLKVNVNNRYLISIILIKEFIIFFFSGNYAYVLNLFPEAIVFFLVFSLLGFLSRTQKKKKKSLQSIQLLCIIAFFVIIISSNSIFYELNISNNFYNTYNIRSMTFYAPLIVILCGYGFKYLETIIKRISPFFNRYEIFRNNLTKHNYILKNLFTIQNLIIILLVSSSIYIHLEQKNHSNQWIQYRFDDYTTESYLFLRLNIPVSSKILTPNFSLNENNSLAINSMLYDMEIWFSPFNLTTKFVEFEQYVFDYDLDYLLIDKMEYNQYIYNNLSNSIIYGLIFENPKYFIYNIN